jgi:hypothetical protein
VTRLGINGLEIVVRLPGGTKAFLLSPKSSARLWAPLSPLIQRISGKKAATGAVHSPPSSGEAKNECNYTSAPHKRHLLQRDINLYQTYKP